jgi:hypothetical protein
MICQQCGAATPDDEWNCVSCRINLYWASRHYQELARIRDAQGLATAANTPPFLVKTHQKVMDDRAGRGGRVEHRVRGIARRFIRGHSKELEEQRNKDGMTSA